MANSYTRITYATMVGSLDPQNALMHDLIKVAADNIPKVTKPLETEAERQDHLRRVFEEAVTILREVKNAPNAPETSEEAINAKNAQCEQIATEFKVIGQGFRKDMETLQSLQSQNASSQYQFSEVVSEANKALREITENRITQVKSHLHNLGIDVAHASFDQKLRGLVQMGTLNNKTINQLVQEAAPGSPKVDIKSVLDITKTAAIVEKTKPVLTKQQQTQATLAAAIRQVETNAGNTERDLAAELNKLGKLSPRATTISVKKASAPTMRSSSR